MTEQTTPATTHTRPSKPALAVLPKTGLALVKQVLSGDTIILVNPSSKPDGSTPEALFTLTNIGCPRQGVARAGTADEPGAHAARMYLRKMLIGKTVKFEVVKASPDRYYGVIYAKDETDNVTTLNMNAEAVRSGHATPKQTGSGAADAEADSLEEQLGQAFMEAKQHSNGMHAGNPIVRNLMQAGEQFQCSELASWAAGKTVKVVLEYCFDGCRFRALVTEPDCPYEYGSFTLQLAGCSSPRPNEPYHTHSKHFADMRLLNRELDVTIFGCDKNNCCVGNVNHPMGNISLLLLKSGLAKCTEWSMRMLSPGDVPSYRAAENAAKTSRAGVYAEYIKPTISGIADTSGVVVEVVSGDSLLILPAGAQYTSDASLMKVSLASTKTPRMGNAHQQKPDEPYAWECKDRLRTLAVGKQCKVVVDYERDIPMGAPTADGAPNLMKRKFATVTIKGTSLGKTLISEGLAVVQNHRDGDEKSSEIDALLAAEIAATAAKKNQHRGGAAPVRKSNDLSDPRKAKDYVGFLQRSGTLKATVEYVFSGSRYKLNIPSENCSLMFALNEVRTPNPSPNNASGRASEPFGDDSKRMAKLTVSQRSVEIIAEGCTNGGVITGKMFVGGGGARKNFAHHLVTHGLANVDYRDIAGADGALVVALDNAKAGKIGLFSLEENLKEVEVVKKEGGVPEEVMTAKVSDIRNGNCFFVNMVGDDALSNIEGKMAAFKDTHGLKSGPVELRKNKMVAAMFDDGSGMAWYRAKVVERPSADGSAMALFLDYGNVGKITTKQVRMLDVGLDTLPAAAKEVNLALVKCRELSSDDGVDAARALSGMVWGKELTLRVHGKAEGALQCTVYEVSDPTSINEKLVESGLARCISDKEAVYFARDTQLESVQELHRGCKDKQDTAKKARVGIWIYGDVGEDDDETARY